MQFPYPRKSSIPPPPSTYIYSRAAAYRQRRLLKQYAPPVLGVVALICFLLYFTSGTSRTNTRRPSPAARASDIVIVTTIDPNLPARFRETIQENRRHYAAKHGYATFFPNTTDYDVGHYPMSWSTVPAMRHAMTLHPHATWLWYLSSTALIMDAQSSLQTLFLEPRQMESLMILDRPVVPPDSVIRTFAHLTPDRVDFILSHDVDGLAIDSMLIRPGEWATFFLDAWFDPLYRSYNFQKAEAHALEHIVQWHMTILARLALIPQRVLNSYTREVGQKMNEHNGEWDFFSSGRTWLVFAGSRHLQKGRDRRKQTNGKLTEFAQDYTKKEISWPTSMGVSANRCVSAKAKWSH